MNTWIIISCILALIIFFLFLNNQSKRKTIKAMITLTNRGTSPFISVLKDLDRISYKTFTVVHDLSLSCIKHYLTSNGADFENFSEMYSKLKEKKFKSKKVKKALTSQLVKSLRLADKDFLCTLYINGIQVYLNYEKNLDHKMAHDALYKEIISSGDFWSRNILVNIKKEIESIMEKEVDTDKKILWHAKLIWLVKQAQEDDFKICS